MNLDYRQEMKKAYLDKHIIDGNFKISFNIQKTQNPDRQSNQKYEVEYIVTGMRIFCNNFSVLKNRNENFLYEECYNFSKKYKNYKYVIEVIYNKNNFYYLFN